MILEIFDVFFAKIKTVKSGYFALTLYLSQLLAMQQNGRGNTGTTNDGLLAPVTSILRGKHETILNTMDLISMLYSLRSMWSCSNIYNRRTPTASLGAYRLRNVAVSVAVSCAQE